jgi:tetraacyldisaccharide 4'-kinase
MLIRGAIRHRSGKNRKKINIRYLNVNNLNRIFLFMQKYRLYFAVILFPMSILYGLAVFIRNLLFDAGVLKSARFKVPVISVGNLTVGGTGKTPHVEYLLNRLKSRFKIAVLSRGYKRRTKGFRVAGTRSNIREMGDEPMQVKYKFPDVIVAVDNRRVHGMERLMEKFPGLEAVILDDAFQHRYIHPTLSIMLVDHERPVFRDFLIPLGNLRECRRNINRADVVIVTKSPAYMTNEQRDIFITRLHIHRGQPVFFTGYQYGIPVAVFGGKAQDADWNSIKKDNPAVLLVTGIANNKPLKEYLLQYTSNLTELRFSDHHFYSAADILAIEKRFTELPAERKVIFTTEKDAAKLREMPGECQNIGVFMFYIPIEVKFLDNGEREFGEMVMQLLQGKTGQLNSTA